MPPMGGMPPGMGMPQSSAETDPAASTPRLQPAVIPDPGTFAAKKADRATLNRKLANGMRIIIDQNPDSKVFAAHFLFKNRSADETALSSQPGAVDFIHHLFDWGPAGMGQEAFQASRVARVVRKTAYAKPQSTVRGKNQAPGEIQV